MGVFLSCCKGGSTEDLILQPDAETRRRQQAEAAERRMQESSKRGIKDPESVRRLERKAEELERLEREQAVKGGAGGAQLRWQMN